MVTSSGSFSERRAAEAASLAKANAMVAWARSLNRAVNRAMDLPIYHPLKPYRAVILTRLNSPQCLDLAYDEDAATITGVTMKDSLLDSLMSEIKRNASDNTPEQEGIARQEAVLALHLLMRHALVAPARASGAFGQAFGATEQEFMALLGAISTAEASAGAANKADRVARAGHQGGRGR